MANQHRHKQRVIRGVNDETWERFTDAVATTELDRSATIAAFIRWYLHEGELPQRPTATTAASQSEQRGQSADTGDGNQSGR